MRNLFRGYRRPTRAEFINMWNKGIFTFDTSVLLDIYRYTPSTREDLFKTLEKLKDQIWLPHQVAFEYREQRENVIAQQYSISECLDEINNSFKIHIIKRFQKGHPFAEIDKIEKIIEEAVEKSKNILQAAQSDYPNLLEEDTYLERILDLFEEKIGESYSEEKMHEIYHEGGERYKQKIPPGYEDNKHKEGMKPYGDLVLWYQIIDYANSHRKPIILVTSDAKGDWWRKDSTGNILGPRPEIIEEAFNKAGISFYMYLVDEFIKRAEQYLNVKVQPGTIQEIKALRENEIGYASRLEKFLIDDYAEDLRRDFQMRSIYTIIIRILSEQALRLNALEIHEVALYSRLSLTSNQLAEINLMAQGISPKSKSSAANRSVVQRTIFRAIQKSLNFRKEFLEANDQEEEQLVIEEKEEDT